MSVPAGAPCTIEPLDPALQDRAAFSCGIVQVDNYFRKTANKLAKSGNVCVFVLTSPQGEVIGLYGTNAHAVHYADLPERFARNRPGHGHSHAAYISMIGSIRAARARAMAETSSSIACAASQAQPT